MNYCMRDGHKKFSVSLEIRELGKSRIRRQEYSNFDLSKEFGNFLILLKNLKILLNWPDLSHFRNQRRIRTHRIDTDCLISFLIGRIRNVGSDNASSAAGLVTHNLRTL